MRLTHLWLNDFRNYREAELALAPDGLTVVVGGNGQGKSNLLEAVGWLADLMSFRGAPPDTLIRQGAGSATVRGEGQRDGRDLLIETEINRGRRTRVLVNRQPLRKTRELLGLLQATVFSPDDLAMVKGGPAERRRWLDGLLVATHPKWDRVISDVERILRQRATLLKQSGGRVSRDVASTLDVWDTKLVETGTELVDARVALLERLLPSIVAAYARVAGRDNALVLRYIAGWMPPDGPGLAEALFAARADDLRRGVTTIGPHRDDVLISLDEMPARTQASQGEQRSVALAMRLGGHATITEHAGAAPILLLDDVFSELDPQRCAALVAALPGGQALLTTASPLPQGIYPVLSLRIDKGRILR